MLRQGWHEGRGIGRRSRPADPDRGSSELARRLLLPTNSRQQRLVDLEDQALSDRKRRGELVRLACGLQVAVDFRGRDR